MSIGAHVDFKEEYRTQYRRRVLEVVILFLYTTTMVIWFWKDLPDHRGIFFSSGLVWIFAISRLRDVIEQPRLH